MAPDSPGSAASQNRWPTEKSNPIAGILATTTDHTIQTEKAMSRLGIEIHRLRVAMALPFSAQN